MHRIIKEEVQKPLSLSQTYVRSYEDEKEGEDEKYYKVSCEAKRFKVAFHLRIRSLFWCIITENSGVPRERSQDAKPDFISGKDLYVTGLFVRLVCHHRRCP